MVMSWLPNDFFQDYSSIANDQSTSKVYFFKILYTVFDFHIRDIVYKTYSDISVTMKKQLEFSFLMP